MKGKRMVSIGMASCKLGVDGAKIVAEMASVMALTSVNLLKNSLDIESATALAAVAKEKSISLCGITPEQTEANFRHWGLGPTDAILIVSDLLVRAELMALDVRYNWMGVEGEALVRKAVKGRSSFNLRI